MEAMAAGLPVIACRVGGIPELVEDGVTGILVPPNDPDALGAAIARVLESPTLAAALGSAAREKIAKHFSMPRMIAGFTDVLLEQLGHRASGIQVGTQPSGV
jgi:glycosyltransferase involved in cell wall biosynthesis